jgi:anti-sigma factor RsiW
MNKTMKTPTQHLPFAKLADLVEDKLPTNERADSTEHISACSRCGSELQRLGQLISAMRTDTSEDAPRDVLALAVNIFRQREAQPSLLRRIVAALSFDSCALAPAFGVRSGQSAARQLLFAAEDNDLDLRLLPQGEEWVIAGQVLGSSCAGGHVELQGETASAVAELNDLCEFKLSAVPSGSYRLRLRLADVEVEVQHLELGK